MRKLSVIVPAYNEEKYIEPTLQALSHQTIPRKNYEIIVVNDASTDNTKNISKKYADKVIDLKKCKSIAQVKNNGVKQAIGKKLLFIDADTIANPDLIEKVINSNSYFGRPKVIIGNENILNWPNNINKLLSKINPNLTFVGGCCMFFDKKFFEEINGFNENLKCLEDLDVVLKVRKKKIKSDMINSKVVTNDRRFKKINIFGNITILLYFLIKYITKKRQEKDYKGVR